MRSRDQRVVELQVEADQLREQAARQNAVVSSLKKRIQVNNVLANERTIAAAFTKIFFRDGSSRLPFFAVEKEGRVEILYSAAEFIRGQRMRVSRLRVSSRDFFFFSI